MMKQMTLRRLTMLLMVLAIGGLPVLVLCYQAIYRKYRAE